MDVRIELDKYRQGIKWMRTKLTRYKDQVKRQLKIELNKDSLNLMVIEIELNKDRLN